MGVEEEARLRLQGGRGECDGGHGARTLTIYEMLRQWKGNQGNKTKKFMKMNEAVIKQGKEMLSEEKDKTRDVRSISRKLVVHDRNGKKLIPWVRELAIFQISAFDNWIRRLFQSRITLWMSRARVCVCVC